MPEQLHWSERQANDEKFWDILHHLDVDMSAAPWNGQTSNELENNTPNIV